MSPLCAAIDLIRVNRRPGALVFAIGFLAFALVLLWQLPVQAPWREGVAFLAQPGLWPRISLATMAGFAALHVLGLLLSRPVAGKGEVMLWLRAAEFGGWLILYTLLIPLIGYLAASLCFAAGLTWRLGYRSARALLTAAGFAVLTVLLFRGLLQVNLPAGAIYDHLPDGLRRFAQRAL